MSGSTPIFGLPYVVEGDEAWKIAQTTQSLAERIEAAMQGRVVSPDLSTLQAEAQARGDADTALAARVTKLETDPPRCQLRMSAAQSVGVGWSSINLQTEVYDPTNMHDSSTGADLSRVVIARPGWYRVSGVVSGNPGSATNRLGARIARNGAPITGACTFTAGFTTDVSSVVPPTYVLCAAGDYLQLQGGGTTANIVLSNYPDVAPALTVEFFHD